MSRNSDEDLLSSNKKWTDFKDLGHGTATGHIPPRSPSELDDFGETKEHELKTSPFEVASSQSVSPTSSVKTSSSLTNLDNPLTDFVPDVVPHDLSTFSPPLSPRLPKPEVLECSKSVPDNLILDAPTLPLDTGTPDATQFVSHVPQKPDGSEQSNTLEIKPGTDPFEVSSGLSVSVSPASSVVSNLSLTKHFSTNVPIRFNSLDENVSIEDDLFTDTKRNTSPDLDHSLDLFLNTTPAPKKKTHKSKTKPPRPPPPSSINMQTEHPLMAPEPVQVDEIMQNLLKEAEQNKKEAEQKKQPKRPKSPAPSIQSQERETEDKSPESVYVSLDDTSETSELDSTGNKKPLSARGQRLRHFRESLKDKANKAYNRWYYPKPKLDELSVPQERQLSESSNESFQEIDCGDLEPLDDPTDACSSHPSAFASPTEQSDNSSDEYTPEAEAPVTSTTPATAVVSKVPSSSSFKEVEERTLLSSVVSKFISPRQQKHILCSILVCLLGVLIYISIELGNTFIQGLLMGSLIPLLCWLLFQFFTSSPPKDKRIRNDSTFQYKRLRSLGSKPTLKDFFQYTETQNFAELRFKNLPYRYVKLKGSIIEAYELNATKDQVPNPAILTTEEIKAYGLKLVFRVNILGWKVSVEPPPGSKVTPNTMWKKKYPIWVRRPTWKLMSNDYLSEDQDVTSFYLFAPYSRYKELWYERLRSVVNKVDNFDTPDERMKELETIDYNLELQNELYENYRTFMEKLFSEIPNEDDKQPTPPTHPPSAPVLPDPAIPTIIVPTPDKPQGGLPPTTGSTEALTPSPASPAGTASSTSSAAQPDPQLSEEELAEKEKAELEQLERERVEKEKANMRDVAWINALFGRFLWNLLHDVKWENRIRDRIVRKLSSVQTARISSLELVHFDLGNSVPLITRTYLPKIDNQGVWSDMELKWTGQVSMSLLVRFQGNASKPQSPSVSSHSGSSGSGESIRNVEQMTLDNSTGCSPPSERTGYSSRILKNLIDRIEVEVSVEVTHVSGRVCVNIPPPPTDCLWYGFKIPPQLDIQITPRLKGINLNYRVVTTALEKQLKVLFDEVFVLPAMESIVIPGMCRDLRTKQITRENLDLDDLELLDVGSKH